MIILSSDKMKIYAEEGKRLTNGVIFGKVIDLGAGDLPDNYNEITETEYQKIIGGDINERIDDLS